MPGGRYFCPSNAAGVFSTGQGNIGLVVCANGSFPEVSRVLALKGAEIICCHCLTVPKLLEKEFMNERVSHNAACRALGNVCCFIGYNRVGSDAGGSSFG